MRYSVRQRPPSWDGTSTIKDGYGHDVYKIHGRDIAGGSELSIRDSSGREVSTIRRRTSEHGRDYEIRIGGELLAVVAKDHFKFHACEFGPDPDQPSGLTAEGNLCDHEYSFTRHGRHVAGISKDQFSWAETYGVEVTNGEDSVTILTCAVVIDICHHDVDVH